MPAASVQTLAVPSLLPVCNGRVLCLEVAGRHLCALQECLAAFPLGHGRKLYVLDAANRFDAYAFSEVGRRLGADDVLAHVFVSRAFTIHQLEAAAERLFPPLLALDPLPLAVVLGIEHLFLEETLPLWERRHVLASVLATLGGLRDSGLPILATHEPAPGAWWLSAVQAAGDGVARLDAEDGKPRLRWLK